MKLNLNLNNDFFVIEGAKDILEILQDKDLCLVKTILWHKKAEYLKEFQIIQNLAFEKNIDFDEINYSEFKELRHTVHSTAIFALIKRTEFDVAEILREANFVIVLDNIQDPGNFGTIIRTASILGASAIITINNSVKLANPKVLRAAKGYFNNFAIIENVELEKLFDLLDKFKFNVFAADMKGDSIYDDKPKLEKPLCLIFGSEGQGLSEFVDKNTQKVCIPMMDNNGKKSLNVAISVGIIIAEVNRKWK